MERYGSLIQIKPDHEERYIILHNNTFPGVLEQIRNSNISNYSIFLRDFPEGKMLFSFFEYTGEDFQADMDGMAADPLTRDWWKLTIPMQIPLESRKEGEWWATIGELFHMDGDRKSPGDVRRYAGAVEIVPGSVSEYRSLYETIHSDVLERFRKSNMSNFSIYLHETRIYSYFEYSGDDFAKDMDSMMDDPETAAFLNAVRALQKKLPGENEWWLEMREVFHTD
jgi:L-rhamnose mutarotase